VPVAGARVEDIDKQAKRTCFIVYTIVAERACIRKLRAEVSMYDTITLDDMDDSGDTFCLYLLYPLICHR